MPPHRLAFRTIALGLAAAFTGACGSSSAPDSTAETKARPASQPSNGTIVFSQQVGEKRDLFTVRPDGSGLKRLTHSPSEAGNPDWSDDGRSLIFENEGITVSNADGSNAHTVGPKGEQGQPSWSPDGRSIVLERDVGPNGVWIMNADGTGARRLTRNPYGPGVCGCDVDPNFSPDGKTISFVRRKSDEQGLGALFTMDTRGGHLRRLTSWRMYPGTKHAWKPDGSLIGFSYDPDPRPGDSANVFVVKPDGRGLRALTHNKGGQVNSWIGSWSPDGRHIVYKSDATGAYQLYVMDSDGSNPHAITSKLNDPATSDWGS